MPIATKNNAIIVKDGAVAENCGCCATEWVCLECDACAVPDAIRVSISSTTPAIYHACVCGSFLPGSNAPTPTMSFAYYIRPISGTFVLPKVGGNSVTGTYSFGDLAGNELLQAQISSGKTPDFTLSTFNVRFNNLARCRMVDGGTPPTLEDMASDTWGAACKYGTGGFPIAFPSDSWIETSEFASVLKYSFQVAMAECEQRGRAAVAVDQKCENGTEVRTLLQPPGDATIASASSAAGCVPPIQLAVRYGVKLLGTASGTSGTARLTNVKAVYDAGSFNGVIPIWLISTSIPSAAWPPPDGHIPSQIYSTPTVQHTLDVTIDSIDMMYGANAVPMFANRGKPACSI